MNFQDADEREDPERAVSGAAAGGHTAAGDERDPGRKTNNIRIDFPDQYLTDIMILSWSWLACL